jgi:3-dehydroquinate synthetase
VSLGLVAALRLGVARGVTPPALLERVVALGRQLGLPVELARQDLERATRLLGHDKKRAGATVRFVFAHAPGDVRTEPLELRELERVVPSLA